VDLEHFGLRELPFKLNPNTRFLVEVPAFREAFEVVRTALRNGEGFVKIVGEVGTGKSLLCRRLLHDLEPDFSTAYVPNPALEPRELLSVLAQELELELRGEVDPISQLTRALLRLHAERRRVAVIVDEAQAMPDRTLEALRLLTNLETESSKLLQVVLLGQPELDARLARRELRQLRQRIVVPHRLLALDPEEVRFYLERRMMVAGCTRPGVFSDQAVHAIQRASRGLPRLVSVLAHKGLLVAYGTGSPYVERRHVARAVADTPDARERSVRQLGWRILGRSRALA
jgi:MSHA biogenesis protein MshM